MPIKASFIQLFPFYITSLSQDEGIKERLTLRSHLLVPRLNVPAPGPPEVMVIMDEAGSSDLEGKIVMGQDSSFL